MRATGQLRSDAFGSDFLGECRKAVDTANHACSQNQNCPEFSTHRSPQQHAYARMLHGRRHDVSRLAPAAAACSFVQALLDDARIERTAKDMPQELSSGQSRTGDFPMSPRPNSNRRPVIPAQAGIQSCSGCGPRVNQLNNKSAGTRDGRFRPAAAGRRGGWP